MTRQAHQVRRLVEVGDIDGLGAILHQGWEAKRKLAQGVSSKRVGRDLRARSESRGDWREDFRRGWRRVFPAVRPQRQTPIGAPGIGQPARNALPAGAGREPDRVEFAAILNHENSQRFCERLPQRIERRPGSSSAQTPRRDDPRHRTGAGRGTADLRHWQWRQRGDRVAHDERFMQGHARPQGRRALAAVARDCADRQRIVDDGVGERHRLQPRISANRSRTWRNAGMFSWRYRPRGTRRISSRPSKRQSKSG
jgi:hypothetical protein